MFQKRDSSSLSGKKNNSKAVDTPVRKSDRRKLRNAAAAFFESKKASVPPELLDSIFLHDSLVMRKLTQQAQFQATVYLYLRGPATTADTTADTATPTATTTITWPYTQTTECVWMTVDVGAQAQPIKCPSIAVLSLVPSFPSVIIPSHASKFICRGAHVMRAGIISVPEEQSNSSGGTNTANKNAIVGIQAYGNPQPFAVGQLKSHTTGNETDGVGVDVWMCYGDDVYQTTTALLLSNKSSITSSHDIVNPTGGAPFGNGHYGNVGFQEGKFVQPIMSVSDDSDDDDDEVDDDEVDDDEVAKSTAEVTAALATVELGTEATASSATDVAATATRADEEKTEKEEVEPTISPDDLLHQSTCQALVNLKDKDLPMAASIFYANHVLPNRSEGTTIQLKQTSFKKFGSYLLYQQDCGLLTVAQDKKDSNPAGFLQSVNRRHADLRGFKKTAAASGTGDTQNPKMAIVTLYVVPNHFVNLMRLTVDDVKAANAKSVDRRGTGMLTAPEVRAILDHYCRTNELIAPNDATAVTLDGPLTDALYKKSSKIDPPTSLSRKQLNDAWLARMEPAHAVVQMPGSRITQLARGMPPRVQIEVSKRSGNRKFLTRVRGIEEYGIDADAFLHDVMKRFACAGALEANEPTLGNLKKGHVELVFQGHLIEELRALLLGDERLTSHGGAKNSEYSIPKQCIVVTLKKGVPAKKVKR